MIRNAIRYIARYVNGSAQTFRIRSIHISEEEKGFRAFLKDLQNSYPDITLTVEFHF